MTATSLIEPSYYTINDLSKLLNMSFERVRQLFMHEPGVIAVPPAKSRATKARNGQSRTRNMYRIPASVVERILRRYTNPAFAT